MTVARRLGIATIGFRGGGAGGGTINRAIISELEVELVEFTAELPAPIVAELPTPVEAELPLPPEAETC